MAGAHPSSNTTAGLSPLPWLARAYLARGGQLLSPTAVRRIPFGTIHPASFPEIPRGRPFKRAPRLIVLALRRLQAAPGRIEVHQTNPSNLHLAALLSPSFVVFQP